MTDTNENPHDQDDGKPKITVPEAANDNDPSDEPAERPSPAAAFNNKSGFIRDADKVTDTLNGRTLLIDAVIAGDLEQMQRLFKAGANLMKPDNHGKTPVHYAVARGQMAALDLLIAEGADLNKRDKTFETPLFTAFASPQPAQMIERLLAAGADANIARGGEILPLHEACIKGELKLAELFVAATRDPDRPDKDGMNALHFAAVQGSRAIIDLLIHNRVDVMAATHSGNTVLHYAARNKTPELALHLLQTPAVRLLNAVNHNVATPLHEALSAEQGGLAYAMIAAGAFPNVADAQGLTPMHMAAQKGALALAEMLSDAGADIEVRTKKNGHTALMEAVRADKVEMVRFLLNRGAKPDTADAEGLTPLMVAANKGSYTIINLLLESGANAALADKQGRNVLHQAADHLRAHDIRRFIHAGADLNKRDKLGRTPLLSALTRSHNTTLALGLVECAANVNIADNNGVLPLYTALNLKRAGVAEKIMHAGADVKAVNPENGQTPLHAAAGGGLTAETSLLLAKGADHTATDKQGRTPLYMACQTSYGTIDAIRLLVDKGADPIAKDNEGTTPYDHAKSTGKESAIVMFREVLQKRGVSYSPKQLYRPPWGGGFII